MIINVCESFMIKHQNYSPYRPKMIGAIVVVNKNIKKIVQKMVVTYKDWHGMFLYSLYAYRTTIRMSIEATHYSLVYGMEVFIPVEIEIPLLKVLIEDQLEELK